MAARTVMPPALIDRARRLVTRFLPYGVPTTKPPAVFPAAVSTDANLLIAQNRINTTLVNAVAVTDTTITVTDATAIVPNSVLSLDVDGEIVFVVSIAGTVCTVTRGFDGTMPVAHSAGASVVGNVVAFHHNTLVSEVEAIETALGPNLSNVGGGASQTPWLQNIDASGFQLLSAGNVGMGNDLSIPPDEYTAGRTELIIGSNSIQAEGRLFCVSNQANVTETVGNVNFVNYAIPGDDKRLAYIQCNCDGTTASGNLRFYIANGTTEPPERMRINSVGNMAIGNDLNILPDPFTAERVEVIIGPGPGAARQGGLFLVANQTNITGAVGSVNFANFASPDVDKRIAYLQANCDGSVVRGNLRFYTGDGSVHPPERMRIDSLGNIAIANDLSVPPDPYTLQRVEMVVGSTAIGKDAGLFLVANQPNIMTPFSSVNFANYAITAAEKRAAFIQAATDGVITSGVLQFYIIVAGVVTLVMQFAPGRVSFPGLPSVAGPAGSGTIWHDPADSNRVHYQP